MSSKPVITYSGERQLLPSVGPTLTAGLPLETVEWKRSYGRPTQAVTLRADLLPLDLANAWLKDANKSSQRLAGCQVLHTYWFECPDVDAYKAGVKDSIGAWFNQLKLMEFQDWLVILVENSDSRKANKLLPRTTVLDKVKSDFGGKTPERCVSVTEPAPKGGEPAKNPDSWQTFLFRVRQALMAALGRVLGKFEEVVRSQRERRNEADWNFCNYFLLQEELAFVFELLGLPEEALVQYDELDALFTQFVLNSAHGDAPDWLEAFQTAPNDWSGACLDAGHRFNAGLRQRIAARRMSVIDFRNYLFARQCCLLLASAKTTEVARRCLQFVHSVQHEVALLKVACAEGACAAWIVLTCLRVLSTCQQAATASQPAPAEYLALLWTVAKDKLYELGDRCGLLPGRLMASDQLHCVATLASGIDDCDDSDPRPTPADRLKEALCSTVSFTRHYLELSELAMGTFKHCGRLRSARFIGRQLARFYVQLGQPGKAVPFLVDLLRGYDQDNWPRLKADTHMELARVYELVGDDDKLMDACASIAGYAAVEPAVRADYLHKLVNYSTKSGAPSKCIIGSRVLRVTRLRLESNPALMDDRSVLCDAPVRLELQLDSNLPCPFECARISISVDSAAAAPASAGVEAPAGDPVRNRLRVHEQQHLKQDGALGYVSVAVAPPQQLRQDSGGGAAPAAEEGRCFEAELVTLRPGSNSVQLVMKAEPYEGFLSLRHLSVDFGGARLVEPVGSGGGVFRMVRVAPTVVIAKPEQELLAGVRQPLRLLVRSGSTRLHLPESVLRLSTSRGLTVAASRALAEELSRSLELPLKSMEPFETAAYDLVVLAELNSAGASSAEYKITVACPWASSAGAAPLELVIGVSAPFSAHYKLHTANADKFVNIFLQGLTRLNRQFQLTDAGVQLADAAFQNHAHLAGVHLVDLNGAAGVWTVSQQQPANFLWRLGGVAEAAAKSAGAADLPPIRANFQIRYRPAAGASEPWNLFQFNFEISNYCTLLTVRSRVEPVKENDFLRAGSLCHMTLSVAGAAQRQTLQLLPALMYEVLADQAMWAVCGRTAGVFSLDSSSRKHCVTLDVMPLVCGFLPLPAVRLSRYIPADQAKAAKAHDATFAAPATLPRLEPFSQGQVYNWSKAQQVHVLAAPAASTGVASLDNSLT